MLRLMTRAVEVAKLPTDERRAAFQQLDATMKDQPILVRLLLPALSKVSDADQKTQAQFALRDHGDGSRTLSAAPQADGPRRWTH